MRPDALHEPGGTVPDQISRTRTNRSNRRTRSRRPARADHGIQSIPLSGQRTAGWEAEFHRMKAQARKPLADHERLFTTGQLAYEYETQGKGEQQIGTLEAKTVKPINMVTEPERLALNAQEILDLKHVIETGPQFRRIHSVLDDLKDADKNVKNGDIIDNTWVSVWHKGSVRTSPQLTVTHWLRNLALQFDLGYPDIPRHGKQKPAFRNAMLKDSSNEALALFKKIRDAENRRVAQSGGKNLALKKSGAGQRVGDKIQGFLAMLVQDMKVVSTRVHKKYIANDGVEHEHLKNAKGENIKQWDKDYFGLLPKTPVPMVYAESLSHRDRALLKKHKHIVLEHMEKAAVKGTELKPDRLSIKNAKLFWEGEEGASVTRYVEHVFAMPDHKSDAYAEWKTQSEDYWHKLLGDNKAEPIYQYDDRIRKDGTRYKELRPAFEYRQLGPAVLQNPKCLFDTFRNEEAFYLTRHLSKLTGTAKPAQSRAPSLQRQASKPKPSVSKRSRRRQQPAPVEPKGPHISDAPAVVPAKKKPFWKRMFRKRS